HARGADDPDSVALPKERYRSAKVPEPVTKVRPQPEIGADAFGHSSTVASAETSSTPSDAAAPGLWTTAVTRAMSPSAITESATASARVSSKTNDFEAIACRAVPTMLR